MIDSLDEENQLLAMEAFMASRYLQARFHVDEGLCLKIHHEIK